LRIGIDARALHYEGVGKYIKELIKHIAKIDHQNKFILYFFSKKDLENNSIQQFNFHNVILPVDFYSPHKQFYLYRRLHQDNLDVFHATNHWLIPFKSPCPVVTTMHDTLIKTARRVIPFKVLTYGSVVTWVALMTSDKIISVSNFTKREITNLYPKATKKISVIYHGVGSEFKPADEQEIIRIRKKYQLDKKYILYVGSLKNHKNIHRLIRAFSKLSSLDIELAIAARLEQRFYNIIQLPLLLGIKEKVKFLGYVPTADLPGLYSGAEAFILPSLIEWFGLPVIEAMACGVPVIASNTGAIPEIAGEAAIYFDPTSTEEIANSIYKVLKDEKLRKYLVKMGFEKIKKFSWKTTAQKTLSVYKEAYNQNVKKN